MFSKIYLMKTIKSNFKLFFIITFVLCGLLFVIMSVFNPDVMSKIASSSGDLPFNPLGDISTLLNFLGGQYFGMFALIFPMIYTIVVGNRMIAGKVDRGDIAYDLSTPITRTQITSTSALYLVGSLTFMFAIIAGVGVLVAEIFQPGELKIHEFLMLTFGAYLLQFAISGIVFISSCIFNRSSNSLIIGAGLPVFFFATNLLAGMSSDLEFFKYTSLITLFDTDKIISGESVILQMIVLAITGIALYISGIFVFKKRDLPL